MEPLPEPRQKRVLQELLIRESLLERQIWEDNIRYSGLKDLDQTLALIAVKLEIANHLLDHSDPASSSCDSPSPTFEMIREK